MIDRRIFTALLCSAPSAPLWAAKPTFQFHSIDGGLIDLAAWRGKPVLIVNTASQCGFTPQYDALQALHESLGDAARILAVPSDDFGGQEYATEAEVKEFCEINFNLTLPMTEITRVRGANAHPFYVWAADQGIRPHWNFHKVLLDADGDIVADYPSSVAPDNPRLLDAISALM